MNEIQGSGGCAEEIRREAEPLWTPTLSLYPYQKAIVFSPARFTWNCWARQTGKSFTFSLRRLIRGFARCRDQIILSAGERQSREVMEKVKRHCHSLGIHFDDSGFGDLSGISIRRLEARLPGPIRILALPANPLTARGYTGDVFLDEFAMHRDDKAIWAALFPTLLRGEGELDVASTPHGRKNMFYRLGNNPRFVHEILPLDKAMAQGFHIDISDTRAAVDDEQIWREEFGCEFLDEATSFMTYELIRSCQDERMRTDVAWDRLRRVEADIYVGVDLGRTRDVTAIWIWERRIVVVGSSKAAQFTTLGVEILRNVPFSEQESALSRILGQPGVRRLCLDATGMGGHLSENLIREHGNHRVEGLHFTTGLKIQLAGELKVQAERGALRIPVDEAITRDWHSISRLVTAGGYVRFDADRSSGSHADRFWAAALGIHAAGTPLGKVESMSGPRLRFSRDGAV